MELEKLSLLSLFRFLRYNESSLCERRFEGTDEHELRYYTFYTAEPIAVDLTLRTRSNGVSKSRF